MQVRTIREPHLGIIPGALECPVRLIPRKIDVIPVRLVEVDHLLRAGGALCGVTLAPGGRLADCDGLPDLGVGPGHAAAVAGHVHVR